MADQLQDLSTALRLIGERCPRLKATCYWAGTSAIALEELHHRGSFDLDFHTRRALVDVRPLLAELRQAFPEALEITQPPDEFGSGFQGVLVLPGGARITLEVLSNHENVSQSDLQPSTLQADIQRVTLRRYLADKVQCVVERAEARDLVDISAILTAHPELEGLARHLVKSQDTVLMVQRLLKWTDGAIERDLKAYPDVSPEGAIRIRDTLLSWVQSS